MKLPEFYLAALCMHCAHSSKARVNNSQHSEKCNDLVHCEQGAETF